MVAARVVRRLFSVSLAWSPTYVCPGGVGLCVAAGQSYATSAGWGSKKHAAKRKVQLQTAVLAMDLEMEQQLAPLRASCKEQVGSYSPIFKI